MRKVTLQHAKNPDFKKIIESVSRRYPDDLVAGIVEQGRELGDGLALFLVNELHDVFDPNASLEQNVAEARRVLVKAAGELVACAAFELKS